MTDSFDEQLRTRLEAIDAPRQPSQATDEIVSARMLARLRDEQATSPVVEIGELTGQSSPNRTGARQLRWLLAAAAALMLVVGLGTIARQGPVDEQISVGDEVPPPSSEEPVTSTDPVGTTPAETPTGSELLGYDPLSTVTYRSEDPVTGEITFLYDRLGETTVQGTSSVGTVRRAIGAELVDLSIVIDADDSIVVPLDFLDPPALGGRCTGGDVPVDVDGDVSALVATSCGRDDITLPVSLAWAETAPTDLDGIDELARALTITIGEGAEQRIATWWFGDAGAIAFELPSGMTFARVTEPQEQSTTQEEGP